ncbi:MATE family efflux transporter [Tunicatimonas pelagia]|uniref:MATE family efflux transporter n=1 Tax=Tunicatimonas pelagia TaxID=931531 RepID=UPI002664E658|nr:MATE family efflux transporter [Tunicatimonas pelagia]WKN43772.1 MATE family efflux transporter [Tunicatimonas pelagia]
MKRKDLTQGSVPLTLYQLTLPMVVGVLSMVAFNLVDTYFIGKLGKNELAALSFTFPVIMVIFSLVQGIGIGATALISQSFGRNDLAKAARETTDSLFLALMLVLIFVITGLFTIDLVFSALGATEEILPLVREYMEIWYFTIVFVIVPFVGNSAIRATGDTQTPSYIMLFAVLINAALDPLLIFGWGPIPSLGLQGAALATAISRGFTMVVSLYILRYRERLITFNIPSREVLFGCWRAILYIGLPTGISRMVAPVAVGGVTALMATYGADTVAAFGVGSRIEILGMSVFFALSAAIAPFIGQNLGQKKWDRIQQAINYSSIFSLLWGVLAAVVLWLLAEPIAALFTDNAQVAAQVAFYLSIIPISFGFQGIYLIGNAGLNTMGKPWPAFVISMAQMFIFYLPLAYLGSYWNEVSGAFLGIAVSYVPGAVVVFWILRRFIRRGVA